MSIPWQINSRQLCISRSVPCSGPVSTRRSWYGEGSDPVWTAGRGPVAILYYGYNYPGFAQRKSCGHRDKIPKKGEIYTGITLPVQVQLNGVTVQMSDVRGVKRLFPYLSTP